MNRFSLLAAVVISFLALAAPADSRPLKGSFPGPCSGDPSALVDGCLFAPAPNALTTQETNFNSFAAQSGESFNAGAVADQNWFAPGAQYPTGPDASSMPAGVTPTNLISPAVGPYPSNCFPVGTRKEISCTNGDAVFNGWDLTGWNISPPASYSGRITIENSLLACDGGEFSLFQKISIGVSGATPGSAGDFSFHNNKVDATNCPSSMAIMVGYYGSGTPTAYLNTFIATPARAFSWGVTQQSCTIKWNYFKGINGNGAHGEVLLSNWAATNHMGCPININSYNTALQNTTNGQGAPGGCAGCDITALFSPYEGLFNSSDVGTLFDVDHTLLILNTAGSSGIPGSTTGWGTAVAVLPSGNYTSVVLLDNLVYTRGAPLCYNFPAGVTITTLNHAGDISMVDGSAISGLTAASCSGHH